MGNMCGTVDSGPLVPVEARPNVQTPPTSYVVEDLRLQRSTPPKIYAQKISMGSALEAKDPGAAAHGGADSEGNGAAPERAAPDEAALEETGPGAVSGTGAALGGEKKGCQHRFMDEFDCGMNCVGCGKSRVRSGSSELTEDERKRLEVLAEERRIWE